MADDNEAGKISQGGKELNIHEQQSSRAKDLNFGCSLQLGPTSRKAIRYQALWHNLLECRFSHM